MTLLTSCTSDASHKIALNTQHIRPRSYPGKKKVDQNPKDPERNPPPLPWVLTYDKGHRLMYSAQPPKASEECFYQAKLYLQSMYLDDGLYVLIEKKKKKKTPLFLIFLCFSSAINDPPALDWLVWLQWPAGTRPSWPSRPWLIVHPWYSATADCSPSPPPPPIRHTRRPLKNHSTRVDKRAPHPERRTKRNISLLGQKTAKKEKEKLVVKLLYVGGKKTGGQDKSFHFVFA